MAPATTTETVDPTSAVPVMRGVLSLVSAAEVMAGPAGATVSTVKATGVEALLRLPTASVAVAVTL